MRPQLPLSSSHLDVYTGPGMKGPAIAMTSNSCPANLTIKRELSGAEPLHVTSSSGARESFSSVPCPVNRAKCRQKKRQRSQFSFWLITFCFYKDAEARALAKERQKKDNHNLSKFHLRPAQLQLRLSCCSVSLLQRHFQTADGGQWTVIFAALCRFS